MADENREIKIVRVDKDEIKISADKNEHWVVPFKLSLSPDESWQKKFYDVQQRDSDTMKRKARIVENTLSVEVFSADDLQKVLDVLKIEVVETNAQCEEDYQKKIKIRQQLEALQKKQRDATQQLKENSDKLVF
ncbi:MAG: hypothetical protein WC450_12515 [Candidatus Omnitrophota bacterium]